MFVNQQPQVGSILACKSKHCLGQNAIFSVIWLVVLSITMMVKRTNN